LNMTSFDTELKAFAISNWRTTQSKWRFKVHLIPWITTSHPPLVAAPNWCGEKYIAKTSWNWRHKARLVGQYNISPMTMGQTPLEGLVMAKRQVIPRICAIWRGMWPCEICEQSWNKCENPLVESFGWNQFWRCSKTILERPLTNKCDMYWNANLKKSNKSSRF
jgi:hypothetical protein